MLTRSFYYYYFEFLCVGLFWLLKNNVLRCTSVFLSKFFVSTHFQGEIGEKGQKVKYNVHSNADISTAVLAFSSAMRKLFCVFMFLGRARHRPQRSRRPSRSSRTEGDISLLPLLLLLKSKRRKRKIQAHFCL